MPNGERVPGWIRMPDSNLVLVERVANRDRVTFEVVVTLPDGRREAMPITINPISGEIQLVGQPYDLASADAPSTEDVPIAQSQTLDNAIEQAANAAETEASKLFA